MAVQAEPAPPEASSPQQGSALFRLVDRVARWVEPEGNPRSAVYGTLAVGLLLAAEDPRYETYPKLLVATSITVALYWFAHAYADLLGARFSSATEVTWRSSIASLWHEWSIVKGAATPVVVLLLDWAAGASVRTGVSAAVWTSAGALIVFELAAGVRGRLGAGAMVANALVGAVLGCAIIGVKLVLH